MNNFINFNVTNGYFLCILGMELVKSSGIAKENLGFEMQLKAYINQSKEYQERLTQRNYETK